MACSLKIDEGVSSPTEKQCELTEPSKVVHFRNLPNECSEDDLAELCTPFGKVVNVVCCVGLNKNQGLVEFEDINQAISMVSHYASSSDSMRIRGRIVYVQHSDRPDIAVNKFGKGNTLLVTMKGLLQGRKIGIDLIHSALVQYNDIKSASLAKDVLDRRSIPRHYLPDHVGNIDLRISYSAHQDLNIKFQSDRTRDYTNPMLPLSQYSIDGPLPHATLQPPENHVLWASFKNLQYDVNVDVLHAVFSEIGTVEKISIFERNGQTQALIQYPDVETAKMAKRTLEGLCIYNDGSELHLSYSRHSDVIVRGSSDKSRDYTTSPQVTETALQNPQTASMYPGIFHPLQAQVYGGIPSWNPVPSYMLAYGTFPDQTYAVPQVPAHAVGQSHGNGMAHNENNTEPSPSEVPSFSHNMQPSIVGFYPAPLVYYYGY
ncbi:polypyrimidine tract-binding protein homolog 1 isoform X1 [Cajanus cajan]|uniref:polypyrimidine tract-binding protein homolog 1 isoform X1 n=1 Tax=Cajanus cajan TaxID=3821 RepID=UPI00098D914F|nr:polypyrimidine tract-binding protein homolog 1 isoform X1 [Cajanus cajan]